MQGAGVCWRRAARQTDMGPFLLLSELFIIGIRRLIRQQRQSGLPGGGGGGEGGAGAGLVASVWVAGASPRMRCSLAAVGKYLYGSFNRNG